MSEPSTIAQRLAEKKNAQLLFEHPMLLIKISTNYSIPGVFSFAPMYATGAVFMPLESVMGSAFEPDWLSNAPLARSIARRLLEAARDSGIAKDSSGARFSELALGSVPEAGFQGAIVSLETPAIALSEDNGMGSDESEQVKSYWRSMFLAPLSRELNAPFSDVFELAEDSLRGPRPALPIHELWASPATESLKAMLEARSLERAAGPGVSHAKGGLRA